MGCTEVPGQETGRRYSFPYGLDGLPRESAIQLVSKGAHVRLPSQIASNFRRALGFEVRSPGFGSAGMLGRRQFRYRPCRILRSRQTFLVAKALGTAVRLPTEWMV